MKSQEMVSGGKQQNGAFFKALVKGALFALSISLIAICIFAFCLRFLNISVDLIKPINQAIKILSIVIGVFVGFKNVKEMGLITGFLVGVLYTALAFVVFSLLNGGFTFETSIINDLLFGGIAGGIAGVVAVNFKKK